MREGVRRGMYNLQTVGDHPTKVRLLGSGALLNEVMEAAKILDEKYNVSSEIWSVVRYGIFLFFFVLRQNSTKKIFPPIFSPTMLCFRHLTLPEIRCYFTP